MIRDRQDICGNCRFYAEGPGSNGVPKNGHCRHGPPTVFMQFIPQGVQGSGVLANAQGQRQVHMAPVFPTTWPGVDPEHWCGKHERDLAAEVVGIMEAK